MATPTFSVTGLGTLDAAELLSQLGEHGKRIRTSELPVGLQGELATATVIALALAPQALGLLGMWLLKSSQSGKSKLKFVHTDGKGGITVLDYEISQSSTHAADAQALKVAADLSRASGLDVKSILDEMHVSSDE